MPKQPKQPKQPEHQEHLREVERELMLVARSQVLPCTGRGRRPGGLDRSAYLLLSRLEADGPMSIGHLAECFWLDTSTVNRQSAAALQAGLVERIPDPDGGMARKLRITAEGGRRLREEREWAQQNLSRVLAEWSQDDVRTFARILARFNTDVERHEGRPWPRHGQPPDR